MPRYTITPAQVAKIKHRLWRGQTCEQIAPDFDVSVSLIRGILSGFKWASVAWPDKSIGAMSTDRRKQIDEARRKAAKEIYKSVERRLDKD